VQDEDGKLLLVKATLTCPEVGGPTGPQDD
jgi:hypothetical protein